MLYPTSFIYGITVFYAHNYFPLSLLFLTLILFLLINFLVYKERKKFFSSFLCAIASAIFAISGFYYAKLTYTDEVSLSDIAGKTLEIRCIAKSEAVLINPKDNKFRQVVQIKEASDEDGIRVNLKEMVLFTDNILSQEKMYIIKARIPRDSYFLNPGSINLASGYSLEIKEVGDANKGIFAKSRIKLNHFIKESFSSESAPFLLSIITGERSLLPKDTKDAFNATGLAHILSISGAHFGLLFFILFKLFRFAIKSLPYALFVRLTLYITPTQIAAILCVPFMIGYLGISNMSVPSIRAFIMITLFLLGLLIQRKGFWLNTLIIAALIILVMEPNYISELSFQLSFIAVLCIGLVVEKNKSKSDEIYAVNDAFNFKKNFSYNIASSLLHLVLSALKISLAVSLATTPLVAYHFHYISLISPITNLTVTPVVGFIILPLSLVCSFVFLISGFFPLLSLIDTITAFTMDVIKHIAKWGFADLKVSAFPVVLLMTFYSSMLIYVIMRLKVINKQSISTQEKGLFSTDSKNRRYYLNSLLFPLALGIIPFIVYLGIRLFEHKGIHVTFLDVGQGDSAVVELPDKKTIVIDTGKKGIQVAQFLKFRGIEVIDAIVLSHSSSDHTGGLWYLMKNFKIKEIWGSDLLIYPEGFPENINIKRLKRGDVFKGDGYKIIILHPYDGFYTVKSKGSEDNNNCLVIKIQGSKRSFLFTADIEKEAEEDLSYLGDYLKSSVLKVPHHGSRTSSSEIFLDVVSPEVAVISVGRNNVYGHPHEEVLDLLRNLKIFRTDKDGAIGIRELADGSLDIYTWEEFRLKKVKTIDDEIRNFKRLFQVW